MAAAAAKHEGGMVAVTAAAAAHAVIEREFGGNMTPANVLAEGVVVYAGRNSHCDELLQFCSGGMRAHGGNLRARATRLPVAGAFHSQLMQV